MSANSTANRALEQGEGILRLVPNWVPRSFCVPGRRIKLHPDDYYALGSDRGVQYAADDFQDLLDDNKAICSMSRKGNCWDNACVESFFGSLKREWVKGKIYETFEDGQKDIFNYIEVFYNRKRRHASLGYVSPAVYEEMHEMKRSRAA